MMQNRVLYTGYKKCNENDVNNSLLLLKSLPEEKYFLFTNNFECISREVEEILEKKWDTIIMFGQKPIVKNLRVELCAKNGKEVMHTNYDISKIKNLFKINDIDFKLSDKPGISYCNFAYFNMLKVVQKMHLDTKVIFIHIPYAGNFRQMVRFQKLLYSNENF